MIECAIKDIHYDGMCIFRKYPYSPSPTEGIGFSWGWEGFFKTKTFKEMYEAYLEFPEGCGALKNVLLWGRYG